MVTLAPVAEQVRSPREIEQLMLALFVTLTGLPPTLGEPYVALVGKLSSRIGWPSGNVAGASPVFETVRVQVNELPMPTVPLTSFALPTCRSGWPLVRVKVSAGVPPGVPAP